MISNNEFDDWGQQQQSAAAAAQANPDGNPNVDLMQVAMRRKGLIALGIFLGLCLGLLYFARATEKYESSAQLLVQEEGSMWQTSRDDMPVGIAFSKADDHAIGISSPRIVTDAFAENPDLETLDSLVGLETISEKVEVVLEGLTVQPLQEGSDVLQLTYKGTNPEDCATILDAIMQTYTNFLNQKASDVGKYVVDVMTEARDDLMVKRDALQKEFDEWREKESRLFMQNDEGIILEQQQLGRIEDEIFTTESLIGALENEISNLQRHYKEGVDPEVLLMLAQQNGNQNRLPEDDLEVRIRRIEELRDQRIETALMEDEEMALRYGPDHPRRRQFERRREVAKQLFEEKLALLGGVDNVEEFDDAAKTVRDYINSLIISVDGKKLDLALLRQKKQAISKQAKDLQRDAAKQRWYETEIQRQDDLFAEAVKKLGEANLEEEYGNEERFRIERFSDPGIGIKTDPSLAKSLAAGTMLGFLAGFGLGYLVEMFDKTFRSPQEVSDLLQLPMIGHIPEIIPEPVEGESTLSRHADHGSQAQVAAGRKLPRDPHGPVLQHGRQTASRDPNHQSGTGRW